jgi:hypothetical protein
MGRLLGSILMLSLLGQGASAGEEITREVPLQHVSPVWAAEAIQSIEKEGRPVKALPAGVSRIRAVPDRRSLVLTGTAAGIAAAVDLVRLVDVPPRHARVTVRMDYVRVDSRGRPHRTRSDSMLTTINNYPARVSSVMDRTALLLEATPRLNGDGTITLTARLSADGSGPRGERVQELVRRVRPGEVVTLRLVLDAENEATRARAEQGQLPLDGGRLEVCTVRLTPESLEQTSAAR